MAAISVEGRCRERNPPDLAIFGAEGERLVPRFVTPDRGQALLARCIEQGTAEDVAPLNTAAGPRCFRISLWRQRGGERIRILAAFAAVEQAAVGGTGAARASVSARSGERPPPAHVLIAEAMRRPVAQVLALAGRLRIDAPETVPPACPEGADAAPCDERARLGAALLAAGWRLRRLTEDLLATEGRAPTELPGRHTETDVGRLLRRVLAMAADAPDAPGHAVTDVALPAQGPLLMTDEAALWSLAELMLSAVTEAAGRAAGLALRVDPPQGRRGVCLSVEAPGAARLAGAWPPPPRVAASAEAFASACGGRLAFATAATGGPRAELAFDAARSVDPV